jgi:TetR/AcrR family transcriptional regulator, transcriptional repressor for nem operon
MFDVAAHQKQAARPRLTARGIATRTRIVKSAAELMYVQGVAATTLDEVLAASATSKSQFYHHFDDKTALVRAVIELRAQETLTSQRLRLEKLDSFRGLKQWRDAVVQRNVLRRGAWGCELGSLAAELSDVDDTSRISLAQHFADWQQLFTAAFERMRDKGLLRRDIDPAALATGLMAALQGGYVLAQTAHDSRPMEVALDMAIDHIKAFQREPRRGG